MNVIKTKFDDAAGKGFFYVRLGEDPAKESQRVQGFVSQLPEVEKFAFTLKPKQHQSIIPGHSIGSSVVGKDINFALRNWKRKLKSADTLNILKDKKEYIKSSVIKRQQMIQASYKQRMQSLNDQD